MSGFSNIAERIALTFWVGSMWSIGYIAAPVLFKSAPSKTIAGNLAGEMFTAVSIIGIICALILVVGLILKPAGKRLFQWRLWVVVFMLTLVLAGQFGLTPIMQQLKSSGLIAGSPEASQFAMLHGIAAVLFLLNCLSGLILVVAGTRPMLDRAQT